MDDDLYIFEVKDAPYALMDANINLRFFPENDPENHYEDFIAPRDKIKTVPGEGDTNLHLALNDVVAYFRNEGNKKIKKRAVLILTDGAATYYPGSELDSLRQNNIIPYFLAVEPNEAGHAQTGYGGRPEVSREFIDRISSYGGKYLYAADERSLQAAFREIDRLEATKVEKFEAAKRRYFYRIPLTLGIALLLFSVASGLIAEVVFVRKP